MVDYGLDTSELPRPVAHRVLDHRRTDDTMMKTFVATLPRTRDEGRSVGLAAGRTEGTGELDRCAERMLAAATLDERFAP